MYIISAHVSEVMKTDDGRRRRCGVFMKRSAAPDLIYIYSVQLSRNGATPQRNGAPVEGPSVQYYCNKRYYSGSLNWAMMPRDVSLLDGFTPDVCKSSSLGVIVALSTPTLFVSILNIVLF